MHLTQQQQTFLCLLLLLLLGGWAVQAWRAAHREPGSAPAGVVPSP